MNLKFHEYNQDAAYHCEIGIDIIHDQDGRIGYTLTHGTNEEPLGTWSFHDSLSIHDIKERIAQGIANTLDGGETLHQVENEAYENDWGLDPANRITKPKHNDFFNDLLSSIALFLRPISLIKEHHFTLSLWWGCFLSYYGTGKEWERHIQEIRITPDE